MQQAGHTAAGVGVRREAERGELIGRQRRQREVVHEPLRQAEVMVEVAQVRLAHVHPLAPRDAQLHEMRGIGEGDMRRVDKESIGGLSVDDQSVRVGVLADSEDAVHRLAAATSCGPCRVASMRRMSLYVLVSSASDSGWLQWRSEVEGENVHGRPQERCTMLRVRVAHTGGKLPVCRGRLPTPSAINGKRGSLLRPKTSL